MIIMAGDKVVCIDDKNLDRRLVRRGGIYTVKAVYGDYIDVGVTNAPFPGYFAWRFCKQRDRLASLRTTLAVSQPKVLIAA